MTEKRECTERPAASSRDGCVSARVMNCELRERVVPERQCKMQIVKCKMQNERPLTRGFHFDFCVSAFFIFHGRCSGRASFFQEHGLLVVFAACGVDLSSREAAPAADYQSKLDGFTFRQLRVSRSTSLAVGSFQAIKGVWWMPWGGVPTKDAISGETPGGAASERRS